MPERPPKSLQPLLDNTNQESQDSCLPITPDDLAKLTSQMKLQRPVLATIALINVQAMEEQKLHKQLREISNQTPTTCIRQFISWLIDLTVPERLRWLQWITENTPREKRKNQVFRKFMEQAKEGFSLVEPDLNALFLLFAKYNKTRSYNREIQTALQKYLAERDLANKNLQPKPKIK